MRTVILRLSSRASVLKKIQTLRQPFCRSAVYDLQKIDDVSEPQNHLLQPQNE